MSTEFAYPWVLWTALGLPLILTVRVFVSHRQHGIASSVPTRLAVAGKSRLQRVRWVSALLLSTGILLGIIALARPRERVTDHKSRQDAVAIELVVDRSGSMNEPTEFDGQQTSRLSAVKKVVEQFVTGDGEKFEGRPGDLLGLIVFGTFADTMMPLTQSHDILVEAIRRIEIPTAETERSTAIGDALVLACARLKASEDSMKADLDDVSFEIKSKVVILLTDGENRDGTYSPQQASALAAEWDIRVYIIGIRGGVRNGLSGFGFRSGQEVNENRMTKVAEQTGGSFWGVNSLNDLADVYAAIDKLERTEVQTSETTRFNELFQPFSLSSFAFLACGYLCCFVIGGDEA